MAKCGRHRQSGTSKRRRRKPPAKRSESHKPQLALPTKGQHHDLLKIYAVVNRQYFNGKIKARITWGPKLRTPQRRHLYIRMGFITIEDDLITIHRALDQAWVPRFFVKYIVFHEMLHLKHRPRKKGRHKFHYAEFVAAEKKFPNYAKAARWEKDNLNRLLFF